MIKIYPTKPQQKILNGFMRTYRYVYNRTLEFIKYYGYEPNFQDLRNILATERTKNHYTIYKCYKKHLTFLREKYNSKENEETLESLSKELDKDLNLELKKPVNKIP